jgi:hypothetical protein
MTYALSVSSRLRARTLSRCVSVGACPLFVHCGALTPVHQSKKPGNGKGRVAVKGLEFFLTEESCVTISLFHRWQLLNLHRERHLASLYFPGNFSSVILPPHPLCQSITSS